MRWLHSWLEDSSWKINNEAILVISHWSELKGITKTLLSSINTIWIYICISNLANTRAAACSTLLKPRWLKQMCTHILIVHSVRQYSLFLILSFTEYLESEILKQEERPTTPLPPSQMAPWHPKLKSQCYLRTKLTSAPCKQVQLIPRAVRNISIHFDFCFNISTG